jgi:hypothetical protein
MFRRVLIAIASGVPGIVLLLAVKPFKLGDWALLLGLCAALGLPVVCLALLSGRSARSN